MFPLSLSKTIIFLGLAMRIIEFHHLKFDHGCGVNLYACDVHLDNRGVIQENKSSLPVTSYISVNYDYEQNTGILFPYTCSVLYWFSPALAKSVEII